MFVCDAAIAKNCSAFCRNVPSSSSCEEKRESESTGHESESWGSVSGDGGIMALRTKRRDAASGRYPCTDGPCASARTGTILSRPVTGQKAEVPEEWCTPKPARAPYLPGFPQNEDGE